MAILSDDEQKQLRGLLRKFRRDGPPGTDADAQVKAGFDDADRELTEARQMPEPGAPGEHKHAPADIPHDHVYGGKVGPPKAIP